MLPNNDHLVTSENTHNQLASTHNQNSTEGKSVNQQIIDAGDGYISLGFCIIGRNLNVINARGYASLITLAQISGPDVLDPILNPNGTQRELNKQHSEDALEYAMQADSVDPEKDPRAFPELTLNVRDKDVLRITQTNGAEIDFDTLSDELLPDTIMAEISIKRENLIVPVPPLKPQISRIDGNHRLSRAQVIALETTDREELEIISENLNVPFALYVNMTPQQERKIFSAYNGKHVGMPASIIDNFEMGGNDIVENIRDLKSASRWLAVELQKEGMPFYGKVHLGGSKTGAKLKFGEAPPLTNRGLATAVLKTLEMCNQLKPTLFPPYDPSDPQEATELRRQERIARAKKMLSYLELYWRAVKDSFPEAWDDKKKYILMSSIGIGGFSQLAAPVIENLVVSKGKRDYEHFKAVMDYMAGQVNLERENFKAVAGAGGIKLVADKLTTLWSDNQIHVDIAIAEPIENLHGNLGE
jgi:DGQHR domain-containing protein